MTLQSHLTIQRTSRGWRRGKRKCEPLKCKKSPVFLWGWSHTGTGAPRHCRVSSVRDSENSTGQNPEQPAPTDPALSRFWIGRSPEVPSHLNCSITAHLCKGAKYTAGTCLNYGINPSWQKCYFVGLSLYRQALSNEKMFLSTTSILHCNLGNFGGF